MKRYLMATLLPAFLIGLLVFFSTACTMGRSTTSVKPEDSCVLVHNEYGHGSGAIVDVNKVLTARHIADQPDLVIQTADGDVHGVIDVIADPNSDAALLIIAGRFDETPLELDSTPLKVRDEVAVIGTPSKRVMINSVLTGRVIKIDVEADYTYTVGENLDMHDCHVAGGVSGGPIVDKQGRIRGIHVMSGYGHGGAVPCEEFVGDLGL